MWVQRKGWKAVEMERNDGVGFCFQGFGDRLEVGF